MYQLQYFVPDGYPNVNAALDKAVMEMCGTLKGVDRKSVAVPNSALSVQLNVMLNGASVEIKKREQLVYLNLFCFDAHHFEDVFVLVEDLYRFYQLGTPKHPKIPIWIHSNPVIPTSLRENEVILCQKITISFFWAVFAQRLKKNNPLN